MRGVCKDERLVIALNFGATAVALPDSATVGDASRLLSTDANRGAGVWLAGEVLALQEGVILSVERCA